MAVPYLTRALAYRLSPAARRSSPRLVSWSAVAGVSGFESCAEYADEGYGGDEWLDRVQGDVGDVADVGHVRDADLIETVLHQRGGRGASRQVARETCPACLRYFARDEPDSWMRALSGPPCRIWFVSQPLRSSLSRGGA